MNTIFMCGVIVVNYVLSSAVETCYSAYTFIFKDIGLQRVKLHLFVHVVSSLKCQDVLFFPVYNCSVMLFLAF